MKKIVLIKSIDNIQAGHIYEHIFCMQLAEYLRGKDLYSYIDYHIDAKTFYSGYVKIELSLFSKRAMKYEKIATKFSIEMNDDILNGAILQIMAEKKADIIINDYEALISALRSYNANSWKHLGDIDNVPRLHRDKGDYLKLQKRDARHFLIMRQTISMDNITDVNDSKEVLYPLFMVISQAILNNLQQIIADSSYCYSYDDNIVVDKSGIKQVNLYRVDKRQQTTLSTEMKYSKEFMIETLGGSFISKISALLGSLQNADPRLAPDDDFITEHTGVLVGAKGWKAIGTEDAIEHVISHMSIDFKLGKTESSLKLADLLQAK